MTQLTDKVRPERTPAESALTDTDLATIERDGYVIIPELISKDVCEEMRHELAPHFAHLGRNPFEGFSTQRIYSLLSKTRATDVIVEHPRVLAVLDRMLQTNYLLSAFLAINILPNEKAQALHYDDAFYPFARPRPPISVATIWAIDDFTEANGATVAIPGSHKWGDEQPSKDQLVNVIMPAGSVVIFSGTLWHGGGANCSDRSRLAITAQYCEPWARSQENYSLAVPPDIARTLSAKIQNMLGYNIHPPFMGHVNGLHPRRYLGA